MSGWTPIIDKLLRKWKKQIGIRERVHKDLSINYQTRHYALGIPTTCLGMLTASGIFVTFANCDPSSNVTGVASCNVSEGIRLSAAILAVIGTIATGVMTFVDFKGQAEQHKTAASNYSSLYREIDSLLLMSSVTRGDAVVTLQSLRSKYDDHVRNSPNLPKKYDADLTYESGPPRATSDAGPIPPSPPDYPPKMSTGTKELMKHILSTTAEQNDEGQDTSDDGDVYIGFDLDEAIQNSNLALRFEMKRMENNGL